MDKDNRVVREADGDPAQLKARLRDLEARLQSAKMDAVGRLAGGVAHDLNNLLTPVLAYGNMLLEDFPPGHPSREFVQEIVKAGDRIVQLTKTLQSLRVKPGNVAPASPDDAVESARGRLGDERAAEFQVDVSPSGGLAVLFEAGQLDRCIEALLRNAKQAMPAGGRIAVSVSAVTDPAPAQLPEGDWVRISVRDEGAGMTPEVREHLYEPYFSTRPKGQGKGLGLAAVYAAVRRAGGAVRCHSEFGAGTEVQLFLRRAPAG